MRDGVEIATAAVIAFASLEAETRGSVKMATDQRVSMRTVEARQTHQINIVNLEREHLVLE